jgi:hypothetical protein
MRDLGPTAKPREEDGRLYTVRWACPQCGLLFETNVRLDKPPE